MACVDLPMVWGRGYEGSKEEERWVLVDLFPPTSKGMDGGLCTQWLLGFIDGELENFDFLIRILPFLF